MICHRFPIAQAECRQALAGRCPCCPVTSERYRPAPPPVQHTQNFDELVTDTIRHNIRRPTDHELARLGPPTGAAAFRKFREPGGRRDDAFDLALGCGRPVLRYTPVERQDHARPAQSRLLPFRHGRLIRLAPGTHPRNHIIMRHDLPGIGGLDTLIDRREVPRLHRHEVLYRLFDHPGLRTIESLRNIRHLVD
jgi:hypothetical protein